MKVEMEAEVELVVRCSPYKVLSMPKRQGQPTPNVCTCTDMYIVPGDSCT